MIENNSFDLGLIPNESRGEADYTHLTGFIDRIEFDAIHGWVKCDSDSDCPRLFIYDGDRLIGEGSATLTRLDLEDSGIRGKGFTLQLFERIEQVRDSHRIIGDGICWNIKGCHDTYPWAFEYTSSVANDGSLIGAIHRVDENCQMPTLKLDANASGVATNLESWVDSLSDTLHFRARAYLPGSRTVSVSLHAGAVKLSSAEIASVPFALAPKTIIGQVNTIGPIFVTGWQLPSASGAKDFQVYVDGQLAGSGVASQPRPDVEAVHGVSDTGFIWPIPAKFRDGKQHTFIVKRKADKALLAGQVEPVVLGEASFDVAGTPQGISVTLTSSSSSGRVSIEYWAGDQLLVTYPMFLAGNEAPYRGRIQIHRDYLLAAIGKKATINCPEQSVHVALDESVILSTAGKLDGSIDVIAGKRIQGWALYRNAENVAIPVDILVDGTIAASGKAGNSRPDLASLGLGDVNHGFNISLPEHLFTGVTRNVVVRCAITEKSICQNELLFPSIGRRSRPKSQNRYPLVELTRLTSVPTREPQLAKPSPRVTVVILTRDGAPVLEKCLQSLAYFVPAHVMSIIIVDHDSIDNTLDVVNELSRDLPIRLIRKSGNGSFSHSNNAAVEQVDTPYVLFLNNDIILLSDAISSVLRTLDENDDVGAVGCKLIEAREGFTAERASVHHAGIALNLESDGYVRAREVAAEFSLADSNRSIDVYGVTGAFFAMRTEEFRKVGGFPEAYFYGGEDVELNVRVREHLQKRIVCRNDIVALHYRGYARLTVRGASLLDRVHKNERDLNKSIGYYNRKTYQKSVLCGQSNMSLYSGVIGFVVREADQFTRSGEYFTAYELGREYERLTGCEVVFVTPDVDWYDVSGIDCLIVMLHEYDIRQIRNASPNLTRVAWMRNHFELWAESTDLAPYDLVMASSERFCEKMNAEGHNVELLRIGAAVHDMSKGLSHERLMCDVVFNGNYAGVDRDFCSQVDPSMFNGKFRVVGDGWQSHTNLDDARLGALDYREMPNVYASTKIVIDDANPSTRRWGGTNSRVFDALAAGCLVVTNSCLTSQVDFDGKLPIWETIDDLYEIVNYYLENDEFRLKLVAELQQIVSERHSYGQRAQELRAILERNSGPRSIAIKIGAPTMSLASEWGDLHYANDIAKDLTALGYKVKIDCLDTWNRRAEHVDVALVLRGLTPYRQQTDQLNIMWLISHPENVSLDELRSYDHVFVASDALREKLADNVSTIETLPQFSNFAKPALDDEGKLLQFDVSGDDMIFIGNTRGVRREFILDIHQKRRVKFIGKGWDHYVSPDDILAEYVDNTELPYLYAKAGCVLNDHWPDMSRAGIISNRIFDVLAAGGLVLSDYIEEGVKLLGSEFFCRDSNELLARFDALQADKCYRDEILSEARARVSNLHRGASRARVIDKAIRAIHARRMTFGNLS